MSKRKFHLAVVCLGAVLASPARADVIFRVGDPADAACTHATVQAAVDDADNAFGLSEIRVAANQAYLQQKIVIDGKNVRLRGGYVSCGEDQPSLNYTRLDGAGGAAGSVIRATGLIPTLRLERLEISGGDAELGGGVHLDNASSEIHAIFTRVFVHSNEASREGGGIRIRTPGSVEIVDSRIEDNRAAAGGGITCGTPFLAEVRAVLDLRGSTTVRGNVASQMGGGIWTSCPTLVRSSTVGVGSVSLNSAASGGGILAYQPGVVTLRTEDRLRPVAVQSNSASMNGGGILVVFGAQIVLDRAIIAGNSAITGGGVYLQNSCCGIAKLIATAGPPPAVPCDPLYDCNRISGNVSVGAGSAVFADGRAEVYLEGTRLTGNEGWSLLQTGSDPDLYAVLNANGALIDGNVSDSHLIIAAPTSGNKGAILSNTTIAGNEIGGVAVVDTGAGAPQNDLFQGLWMRHSLVWQPGKLLMARELQQGRVRCTLSNSLANVPLVDLSNVVADPHFLDAAGGDYRLQMDSPAIDKCVAFEGWTRDGGVRIIDLPGIDNGASPGPRDSGAYERDAVPVGEMFADGFEG